MLIRRRPIILAAALGGAAALAGCQADGAGGASSAPVTDERVVAAIEDLADRIGVEPNAVRAGDLEPVVWPDGSLGCPEPDMLYTQAQVDGVRVTLEADAVAYAYHGAQTGLLAFCATPTGTVG